MKAVFPLINDDLVKFNQNLENQANSSGTALKATEEFQGTLSFQFSQIVKNVGNLARGLDEVLGPAFKGILGTVNDIVSRMNEAVALMRVFPAYQELGKAGADITFGMESKGMERLIAGVGMAETSLAGATNLEDLEAVSTLINKIRNQANRVNSKRQEDNFIELLNAIDTIRENIKLRELEIIEAQAKESSNNDEINNQIKTKSSLLDEIFAKNSVQFDQVAALTKLYTEMSMTIRNGLVDAIEGAINGTRTLGEVASAVFSQIQRSLITYGVNAFLGSLGGGLGSFFGLSGGRSLGGGVLRGSSYMVGERGPEIFTPSSSGRISTGGATNVVVNVDASGSSVEGDENRGKQLGQVLSAAIQAELVNQKRPGGLLA